MKSTLRNSDPYLGVAKDLIPILLKDKKSDNINYLIKCFIPYVEEKVREVKTNNFEDLFQSCMLEVANAIYRYDETLVKKEFVTYVKHAVVGVIKKYQKDTYDFSEAWEIEKLEEVREEELHHVPKASEMKKFLTDAQKKLYLLMKASKVQKLAISEEEMFASVNDDITLRKIYEYIEDNFSEEEKYIFYSYYNINGFAKKNKEELAYELHHKDITIKQILDNCLAKLQVLAKEDGLSR